MATQKPISTISYNSEAFLREKLDSWVDGHIIQAYQYIVHKGEDGDKDHIHVRIEPNKKLDPMDLQEQLREFKQGQEKPLGCRTFRPSKEEDWFLYAVHDKAYLKLKYGGGDKGEKIAYSWKEIKASPYYDVEIAFTRAKAKLEHTSANLASRLSNGESANTLYNEGENPFMVNAILRGLHLSDYERLAGENRDLRAHVSKLEKAIGDYGLEIVISDSGDIELIKGGK